MLELLAVSFTDGWAFVRKDDRLLLLRPPYRTSNLLVVDESVLKRSIAEYGFEAASQEFDDWPALLALMRNELSRVHSSLLGNMTEAAVMAELLRDATQTVIEEYLDRIRTDLIPRHRWIIALDLLRLLVRAEAVKVHPQLLGHVVDLMEICATGVSGSNPERIIDDQQLSRQFPNIAPELPSIMLYARRIAERHQILSIGSSAVA